MTTKVGVSLATHIPATTFGRTNLYPGVKVGSGREMIPRLAMQE